ncbi:neuropilin and tolloid-like [Ptiloglossa arizonensis]|uniref:neuropilin and tolloid-like n=1 Tax=Ptiloglossa arizonensis TaxID=3350558 RepID=UPI003FA0448F
MLLQGAAVIVRVESVHGGIGRFQFINVREKEPTMVARLPQQVLLLLVLVTGTAAEATRETKESLWTTYDARRTGRSFPWSSTSTERAAAVTRSIGKSRQTSSWHVENTSSREQRVGFETLELVSESPEIEAEIEMQGIETLSGKESDAELEVKISCENSTVSSRRTPDTRQKMNLSAGRTFIQSTIDRSRSSEDRLYSDSFDNIVASNENRLPNKTIQPRKTGDLATTPTPYILGDVVHRQMRHVPDVCEKFSVGDEAKQEFYSPNYPDNYPNLTECVRVLEADKGMLLKLDFRDEFKLEESPDCRYDFLEVRDGQHGYSNLLGNFCGTNFPPEITSKTRYLWLRFHSDDSIEAKGFKAVWSMIPRPTYPGLPPEPEPCVQEVSGMEAVINSDDVLDRKKLAEKEGIPLDCMWNITVKEGWKIQLTFSDPFKLQRPNECDANFVDIFKERTDMSSREKNFCGSIADTVVIQTNNAFVRFYAEPKALNSSFEAVMTALRDRDQGDKPCRDDEYYCEDATCIAADLQCNGRVNCRFRWDEEDLVCNKKKSRLIDSQHIVIILIVFSLILFGMSFAFVFNCVRKLVRDHRIIREHIRQSRENRLDELGRKATPCPISSSRTDIGDRGSDSPSLEVVPSKELLPPTTLIAQEYTKDLVLEMGYGTRDMNDIHQSNNVSNATQERLQESNEEPEMRDNSCQTRESLFESRIQENGMSPGFTTFGVRGPSVSQNGTNHLHHHRHHHLHHHQSPLHSRQSSQTSQQSAQQSAEQSPGQQPSSQCSGCSPASRGRDGSMGVCPKHNPIPAPPGWSSHEPSYPLPMHHGSPYSDPPDYPSYQRYQSPKPSRENSAYRQSPKLLRQATVGSGERYASIYGSGHGSSNTSSTQHSVTPKCPQQTAHDPRYRAEAVIEVDQRRPFSIESTKSAPDVIATH